MFNLHFSNSFVFHSFIGQLYIYLLGSLCSSLQPIFILSFISPFEFISLSKLHILYKFMLFTAITLFHCLSYFSHLYHFLYFHGL